MGHLSAGASTWPPHSPSSAARLAHCGLAVSARIWPWLVIPPAPRHGPRTPPVPRLGSPTVGSPSLRASGRGWSSRPPLDMAPALPQFRGSARPLWARRLCAHLAVVGHPARPSTWPPHSPSSAARLAHCGLAVSARIWPWLVIPPAPRHGPRTPPVPRLGSPPMGSPALRPSVRDSSSRHTFQGGVDDAAGLLDLLLAQDESRRQAQGIVPGRQR